MDEGVLHTIDKLVKSDRLVYAHGATRLLRDLCSLQKRTGTQLVCRDRMVMLYETTEHVGRLWEPGQHADNECLQGMFGEASTIPGQSRTAASVIARAARQQTPN